MKSSFSRRAFLGAAAGALALASVTSGIGAAEAQSASRVEAFKASQGKIVLFYGNGVRHIEAVEGNLNNQGYPTVSYSGGPNGVVELFIDRHIYGKYNQDQVELHLSSDAAAFYRERIGQPQMALAR